MVTIDIWASLGQFFLPIFLYVVLPLFVIGVVVWIVACAWAIAKAIAADLRALPRRFMAGARDPATWRSLGLGSIKLVGGFALWMVWMLLLGEHPTAVAAVSVAILVALIAHKVYKARLNMGVDSSGS